MDFIKGNDLVRIDPSGIDISGAGHIVIDSNSITGDISMNGKVSISDNFDVSGNVNMNGMVGIGRDPSWMFDMDGGSVNSRVYFSQPHHLECELAENGNAVGFYINHSTGTNVLLCANTAADGSKNVGIRTADPEYPLDVRGSVHYPDISVNYTWINKSSTNTQLANGDPLQLSSGNSMTISIRSEKGIACPYIYAYSDERIKTEISDIDDGKALMQINQLESKEYHYIDPERRRPMKTIGFIAQEVKEIIPNAVGKMMQIIPDEMRMISEPQWTEDAGKHYLNIPDLDMSGAFTNKAKFYVSNDPSGNNEVCKEVVIKEVPTTSMNEFSTTNYVAEFDQSWNNVFFYGKEVTDFHTIDKAQIFALHHSAIQELDRKHERETQDKNNRIQSLEGEVNGLNGQVYTLTSRLEALEGALVALQNNQ